MKDKALRILKPEEVALLSYAPPTAKQNRPVTPKYFERPEKEAPTFRTRRRVGMK